MITDDRIKEEIQVLFLGMDLNSARVRGLWRVRALSRSLSLSQLEGKFCKYTMHITDMLLSVLWQHPLLSSFQQHFITRQARN